MIENHCPKHSDYNEEDCTSCYLEFDKKTDFKDQPTITEYRRAMRELALDFCPPIKQCQGCKWPYIDGYCCTFCKRSNP